MKIFFILLLTCIVTGSNCFSQVQWPPVFEIKTDTIAWQNLDPAYWQIMEDKKSERKPEDILQMHSAGKFHSIHPGFDTTVHTYWFAYRLHNAMKKEARVCLNSISDFDQFYVKADSTGWKHFSSGQFTSWEKKDGYKFADCIPVTIQPGEAYTVYQGITNKKPGLPKDFHITVLNTDSMIRSYYVAYAEQRQNYFAATNLQEAFIIGMILLAAFLNFFFYRIVKEKVYLYFALFALFIGVNRLYGIGITYFTVFRSEYVEHITYLSYAWVFISFFLVQFFRHFLNTPKRFPLADKWLLSLCIFFTILSIIRLFATFFGLSRMKWQLLSGGLTIFLAIPFTIVILQLCSLRHTGKANRFVLAGSLPLLLFQITATFFSDDVFSLWPENALSKFITVNFRLIEAVCMAILLVSFTWVLLMRFMDLRKENAQQALDKERLAREKETERNELIAKQKIQLEKEVEERTAELKQSLEELKATQSQLIQSEKMASLGELTAGIAHEIQNPLNFVNNFSEVSNELLEEMKDEMAKGNYEDANAIANDVKQNLEKINHHGKRADAIVKGMLQHSRTSSGQKELTDINALCDEYLRLSYHGLRAKDKAFNAKFDIHADSSIEKINIVPQDIGRVILNLINNAFYAVNEKKKQQPEAYTPTVLLNTEQNNERVLISVTDNGNGIPKTVVDKIFQPFFTTKPTGEGTGLGLSLSYDIIKAHGGELKVETKEHIGTTFIISLPK